MGKSKRDIITSADELAERCERYEPNPADERAVDEYLDQRAARRAHMTAAADRVIDAHTDALDRLGE